MAQQDGAQRESKFLEIFETGKRFTEDLLRENERLRMLVAGVRSENAELGRRCAGLTERLRLAEEEGVELRRITQEQREQFTSIEAENCEFAERYVSVERQYSDLIHLYVSSYRLHSTLEYGEVLRILKEIVINVVGAESFGIYVVDDQAARLTLVAHEELVDAPEHVPLADGPLAEVAHTGKPVVRDPGPGLLPTEPSAVIPLRAGDRVVGVLAIYKLLRQKDSFQNLDYELFDLLGSHAATALCAATLYTLSERKRVTLENLVGMVCHP